MTTPEPVPALTGTITVGVPVERAFSVFTGSLIRSGGGWTAILELVAKAAADAES